MVPDAAEGSSERLSVGGNTSGSASGSGGNTSGSASGSGGNTSGSASGSGGNTSGSASGSGGNTSGSASGSGGNQGGVLLPVHRVKMIMKSCPDVESVQQESLQTVAKATELFIAHLARESLKQSSSTNQRLDYDDLSELVKSSPQLEFLQETVPGKITWAECQKLMAEKANVADYI
ncbi:Transcription factor CBF/NF-Y/archaeal histone domain [Trinorchestia longiramus]|nr:Transcription factor CBF/NF-Y/archaeal histone domain [Trinorchestia longiramus]